MRKIFPLPIVSFVRVVRQSGGLSLSKIFHLLPWLLKFIVFEPLRMIELWRFRKKIERHQITKDPVFILGYYRSGTTYLQRLFIQDRQLGYQSIFHSALPELMLGFETVLRPVFSFFTTLFRVENKFHKVPFIWDFPGEEDVALTAFGVPESANWANLFPRAFQQYFNRYVYFNTAKADQWQDNYLFWLKKLSIKNGGRQLLLKSPPNTARIALLLRLFPDAKFVCIQRNPYDVFASGKGFWKIVNRYYALQKIPDEDMEQLVLDSFSETMDLYQEQKTLIPPGNLVEVAYEQLVRQPAKVFQEVYAATGLTNFAEMAPRLNRFIEQAGRYPFSSYTLTEAERERIAACWGRHISHWEALNAVNKKPLQPYEVMA